MTVKPGKPISINTDIRVTLKCSQWQATSCTKHLLGQTVGSGENIAIGDESATACVGHLIPRAVQRYGHRPGPRVAHSLATIHDPRVDVAGHYWWLATLSDLVFVAVRAERVKGGVEEGREGRRVVTGRVGLMLIAGERLLADVEALDGVAEPVECRVGSIAFGLIRRALIGLRGCV